MNWGLVGLRFGSGVGFFAGVLVLSNFSIFIAFALAFSLSILVIPVALLFKHRRRVRWVRRNWMEMGVGFSASTIMIFVASLYYFWLGFLAFVTLAVANAIYGLIEAWNTRNQGSVEVHRLLRNLIIMVAVMAPSLFFAVLVIKGVLAIIGWAIAHSAFSSVIIAKYIKDRGRSRAAG